MSEEAKLLPCPFCGGRATFTKLYRSLYSFVAQCETCRCYAGGTAYKNDSFNANAWNTRAPDPQLADAQVEIELLKIKNALLLDDLALFISSKTLVRKCDRVVGKKTS